MRHALALILFLASAGVALADDAVETDAGDAEFGQELFESLCISCHKDDAAGDDRAPDIRGATVASIKRGTSGMDSMQDFHFEAQEIADLYAFLHTLVE